MSTQIPMEWTASAATKRLSWSWTMNLSRTRAAMPVITARKAFTFGGCLLTHDHTVWIGLFILNFSLFFSDFLGKVRRKKKVNYLWEAEGDKRVWFWLTCALMGRGWVHIFRPIMVWVQILLLASIWVWISCGHGDISFRSAIYRIRFCLSIVSLLFKPSVQLLWTSTFVFTSTSTFNTYLTYVWQCEFM